MVNIYPACYCAARVMGGAGAGAGRQRVQSGKHKMFGDSKSSERGFLIFFFKMEISIAPSSSVGLVLIFISQTLLVCDRGSFSSMFRFFSSPVFFPDLQALPFSVWGSKSEGVIAAPLGFCCSWGFFLTPSMMLLQTVLKSSHAWFPL